MGTLPIILLQHIFTSKKFILSTKSAKPRKINVRLTYKKIHIFCPQSGDIIKQKSSTTKDIFVLLRGSNNNQNLTLLTNK